jgi:hypothetical protein
MQLLPERLGDNDTACFVNDEASVHFGIIIWVDPSINPIIGFLQIGLILGASPKKGKVGW